MGADEHLHNLPNHRFEPVCPFGLLSRDDTEMRVVLHRVPPFNAFNQFERLMPVQRIAILLSILLN